MSQPTRYGVKQTLVGIKLTPMSNGEWLRWSDYNALAAEVELLRKAGDAMDEYLKRQDGTTNGMLACRKAWLSAKEGRDAK